MVYDVVVETTTMMMMIMAVNLLPLPVLPAHITFEVKLTQHHIRGNRSRARYRPLDTQSNGSSKSNKHFVPENLPTICELKNHES